MIDSKRDFAVHFGNSPFQTEPLGLPLLAVGFLIPIALLAVAVLLSYSPETAGVVMAVTPLVAKREELKEKRDRLAAVWKEAGEELDLKKVKKFGDEDWSKLTTEEKAKKIRDADKEMTELGKDIEDLVALKDAKDRTKKLGDRLKTPMVHSAPSSDGKPGRVLKSLGQRIAESKQFKSWHEGGGAYKKTPLNLELEDVYPSELLAMQQLKNQGGLLTKTLFETSAGWAPESTRIGRLIDEPTRPIELLDIIPMERTGQTSVVYMEETTRTHAAAEKAEGAAYAESTFVTTEQSSSVRKITDSIPVTDEQLDDVPMVEGYLQNRLLFGVRQRLDDAVLTGTGVSPILLGILNTGSIQTQAKGADPTPDAFYKAMTKVMVTGRANPTAIVMHANDWQAIRLLRTADGIYIWGSPSEPGPERMWGLPVVKTTLSENTGLVGAFNPYCSIFERMGVSIEVGYVDAQFTEGKKTLRAQMRAAFVVFRPEAFCTVTGI